MSTDHSATAQLARLAVLGAAMRDAQRTYFRTRTHEALLASKEAERAFDAALKEISTGQQMLA
jgi:hypothetical protein